MDLENLSNPFPYPYPNPHGAGERLKAFLKVLLPQVLETMGPGIKSNPMASTVLNFVPTLLDRQVFTDGQAVELLEGLDDLVARGFREVLGVTDE